jgi:hypothetical protein
MKRRCSAAVSRSEIPSWGPEIAIFPVKFPVSRNLRGDRRDQHCVASHPFWRSAKLPKRRKNRPGNPGFSGNRLRLWTPALPNLRWKLRKVSGLLREYSRFEETVGGDGFDQDYRPTVLRVRIPFPPAPLKAACPANHGPSDFRITQQYPASVLLGN